MKWMPFLERNLSLVILVGTLVTLVALGIGAALQHPAGDALLQRHEMKAGPYGAILKTNTGADKPLIVSSDDRVLLDTSAWESKLRVNGTERILHRHEWKWAADGNLAYVTWSDEDYSLEERIEVTRTGVTLTWSWLRAPQTGDQTVELELAQFAFYLENASWDGRTVRYGLAPYDARYPSLFDPTDPQPYDVRLAMDVEPHALWFGQGAGGLDSFHARFRIDHPPAALTRQIVTQHLTFTRGAMPPAPEPGAPIVATPTEDPEARAIVLHAGDLRASLGLGRPTEKPSLRDGEGRLLVDLSASESAIRVDGALLPLHLLDANITRDGTTAYANWSAPGYHLLERVTARDDGLDVAWFFTSATAREVELLLTHYAPNLTRASAVENEIRYEVDGRQVQVLLDRGAGVARFGETADGGIDSFRIALRADTPPGTTLLLSERFVLHDAPLPPVGPDGVLRVARPVETREPRAIVLAAGDYHASLALTKGSDKPLVTTRDGRAIVEVSGWESLLAVNGHERSLYRHEYALDLLPDAACVRWLGEGYTLRECVRVTSEGVTVNGTWTRHEGAPAQDVRLTLAHFAPFLERESFDERGIGWDLDGGRYHVLVAADPLPARVDFGRTPDGRTDAARAVYALDAPIGDTLLFSETITYARGTP